VRGFEARQSQSRRADRQGFALLALLTSQETEQIEFKRWRDSGSDPRSPILGHLWAMAIAASDTKLTQALPAIFELFPLRLGSVNSKWANEWLPHSMI
jgi:hypothetical protein